MRGCLGILLVLHNLSEIFASGIHGLAATSCSHVHGLLLLLVPVRTSVCLERVHARACVRVCARAQVCTGPTRNMVSAARLRANGKGHTAAAAAAAQAASGTAWSGTAAAANRQGGDVASNCEWHCCLSCHKGSLESTLLPKVAVSTFVGKATFELPFARDILSYLLPEIFGLPFAPDIWTTFCPRYLSYLLHEMLELRFARKISILRLGTTQRTRRGR